jgi:hypothetical protein
VWYIGDSITNREANMSEKRYVVAITSQGYWGEGESISDAVAHLPTSMKPADRVAIMAVPGDGVERLSVDEMGRVSVHGPNQDEAAAALQEVYVGLWGQRGKRHLS